MERRRAPLGDLWTMVTVQDGQCALNCTHIVVGTLPRQQLPTNNAVTKDIRLFIIALIGKNFNAHPLNCGIICRRGKRSKVRLGFAHKENTPYQQKTIGTYQYRNFQSYFAPAPSVCSNQNHRPWQCSYRPAKCLPT
jgi:hypothetical protein